MESARSITTDRAPTISVAIPLPLLGVLASGESAFFSLCLTTGREVLTAMTEQERTFLCEPKGKQLQDRQASRAGSTPSEVKPGG